MSTDLPNLSQNQFPPGIVTWEQDYVDRVNPRLMTRLLSEAIPVIKYVGWEIREIREGYCRSRLPLNFESTNQHGSHQAALMSIAADYTGGVAIASLLRGVPIGGVHPGSDDRTAALWLASMQVKYHTPSTGHLAVECRISKKDRDIIQKRYFSGRRIMTRLNVELSANEELVATAEMTYFAQPSRQLRPSVERPRISPLFKHKLKASARLIAGLRGGLGGSSKLTAHCRHSRTIAGPHGQLLARRLNSVLPQLQDMVLARTEHIDAHLSPRLKSGLSQVVLMGAGLDVRAFRHAMAGPHAKYFEVDLPEMLAERERVVKGLQGPCPERIPVAMNFETDRLDKALRNNGDFDPWQPTAFIYEGCSMYFDGVTNASMLTAARKLMQHPMSFLWVDFVATDVVDGQHRHKGIAAFLEGMEQLGEAFVFGVDDPDLYLRNLGFGGGEGNDGQRLARFLGSRIPSLSIRCCGERRRKRSASISDSRGVVWPLAALRLAAHKADKRKVRLSAEAAVVKIAAYEIAHAYAFCVTKHELIAVVDFPPSLLCAESDGKSVLHDRGYEWCLGCSRNRIPVVHVSPSNFVRVRQCAFEAESKRNCVAPTHRELFLNSTKAGKCRIGGTAQEHAGFVKSLLPVVIDDVDRADDVVT